MKKTRFLSLLFLLVIFSDFLFGQELIKNKVRLLERGSSRATAYAELNKIIETEDNIFIISLGFKNDNYCLIAKNYSKINDKVVSEYLIDSNIRDNHGGGTMVMDSQGIIHLVYGAHNGKFVYRHTLAPNSIKSWSRAESIGNNMTYPSLAIDANDKLFLLGRQSPSMATWKVLLYTKDKFDKWSTAVEIIRPNQSPWVLHLNKKIAQFSPYIRTNKSIQIGSDNSIHIVFRMYEYLPEGKRNRFSDRRNGVSYMIGYIYSKDGGNTWLANNSKVSLPVKPNSAELIAGVPSPERAATYFNISNLALSQNNIPYIGFAKEYADYSEYYIAYRSKAGWIKKKINIKSDLYLFGASGLAIYNNALILATNTISKNMYHRERLWGNGANRVAILKLTVPDLSVEQFKIEESASWLPTISQGILQFPPRVIYTKGIHTSNQTQVILIK